MVAGCWDRAIYYNGPGTIYIPYVCFDGVFKNVTDSYASYRAKFNQRKVIDSPLSIFMNLTGYDASTGVGHLDVTVVNASQTAVAGYLRLVATGDDTLYGGLQRYWVAADVFPSSQGVSVALDPGGTFQTTQQFDLPSGWRHKPCTVVGFVQEDVNQEILQAAVLHEVVLWLSSDLVAGQLVLDWPGISGAAQYRVHGMANNPFFMPVPGNLLATLPAGTTTWSTPNGIGDPNSNWTYLIIALDGSSEVVTMSGRSGEFDFGVAFR